MILLISLPIAIASLLPSLLYLSLDCCFPCCPHSPACQESVLLLEDQLVEHVKIMDGRRSWSSPCKRSDSRIIIM